MCLKNEEEYNICFDYVVHDYVDDEINAIKPIKNAGVEIVNEDEFASKFLDFLDDMHDKGIIKPKK